MKPTLNQSYKKAIEEAILALKNQNFSYNPQKDEFYLAYLASQTRRLKRQSEDTLANASEKMGGRLNSFALQLAQQNYNEGVGQLHKAMPTFEKMHASALTRKQQATLNALANLQKLDDKAQTNFKTELDLWQKTKAQQSSDERQNRELAWQREKFNEAQALKQALAKQKMDFAQSMQAGKLAHAQATMEARANKKGRKSKATMQAPNWLMGLQNLVQKYGKKKGVR